jgi:hypothetical protein
VQRSDAQVAAADETVAQIHTSLHAAQHDVQLYEQALATSNAKREQTERELAQKTVALEESERDLQLSRRAVRFRFV